VDIGHFDGATEPTNPHGAMGWGWTLDYADGHHDEGQGSVPPAHGNTNNIAEYRAALALVEHYVAAGGQGPLHVYGDSMLVVQQVNRAWACRQPHLQGLRRQVWDAMQSVPGGVTFAHVPREQNSAADALSVAGLAALGITRNERRK
jgi:ribonuclease HI